MHVFCTYSWPLLMPEYAKKAGGSRSQVHLTDGLLAVYGKVLEKVDMICFQPKIV